MEAVPRLRLRVNLSESTFQGAAARLGRRYRVIVDSRNEVDEWCEMNNVVIVQR